MANTALFELADLVGLSQSAIAAHLGISRVQVHRWVHGQRPIPQHFLEPLEAFIFNAAVRKVETLQPPSYVTLAQLGDSIILQPERDALCRDIITGIHACADESLERYGKGPTASLVSILGALQAFYGMAPADLRKRPNAQRLLTLAEDLWHYAKRNLQLSPMADILTSEERYGYDHRPFDESGDARE